MHLQAKNHMQGLLTSWIKKKLTLSAIVVAEFLSRATDDEELAFRDLLENFAVLPVDSIVAQAAVLYRKKLQEKKKKVWLSDCLISATCKVYGAILATFDKKEYPMEDCEILGC